MFGLDNRNFFVEVDKLVTNGEIILKIAFLTSGLSEIRGGALLLYNYARALKRYYNIDTAVYSIEKQEDTHVMIKSILHEDVIPKIRLIKLPWEERPENIYMKTLTYISRVSRDVIKTGPSYIWPITMIRRGRGKYRPELNYYETLLLKCFKNYDIVHMGFWNALYTFVASKLRNKLTYKIAIQAIFHPSDSGLVGKLHTIVKQMACKKIFPEVDAIATSTPYEATFFRRFNRSLFNIGEGIDLEYLEKEAKSLDTVKENIFTVIYIGERNYAKGYYYAILALNELAKAVGYSNIKVIIIGRKEHTSTAPQNLLSSANKAYKKLREHGNIEDYIIVSEKDKVKHLKRSHVLLLPSKAETIPLVALEAWALKRPSILADIPTVKSVIKQDGNGAVLVKYGDIHGIAQKLKYFYSNPKFTEYTGFKGYSYLKRRFTLKSIAFRLFHMYKTISSAKY